MMQPRRPTTGWKHARPGTARVKGLVAAAVLLLAFAGVVVFFARREQAGAETPIRFDSTNPPDITRIPTGGNTGMASGLVQGSAMQVQLVDEKDPSRVQAVITADRSTPLANNEFSLTKPKARVFLRDGRTVLVDADKGRARMPQGAAGRPQDGLLEGNVVIRLFAPTPDHKIGPNDKPLLTTTAPTAKFDASLGRLEFPDAVKTVGDQIDFAGDGMIVLYDEAKKRINGVHLDRLRRLVIYPAPGGGRAGEAGPAALAPREATSAASTGGAGAPTTAARTPVESLYRMVAHEKVTVRQGARSIASDDVLAWLRLVDGKLRPAAVASLAGPERGARPAGRALSGQALFERRSYGRVTLVSGQPVGSVVKTPAPPSAGAAPTADEPIEIHWAGSMDAVLESTTPAELSRNDVFVRFTSDAPLGTVARDEIARAQAMGSLIDYGATTRDATVSGPEAQGAMLKAEGRGQATGERFEIALNTGLVRSPGQGVIRAERRDASPGAPAAGTLAWARDAEFQMAMEKGQMQPRPTSAKLRGDVRVSDGLARVRAESLDATFFSGTTALAFVQMVGNTQAEDGKPRADAGRLAADTLDLTFAPGPGGTSSPSRLDLNGHAKAGQGPQQLEAGRIIAELAQDQAGRTQVTAMNATQDVAFIGKDGTTITGDEMRALPADDWADVKSQSPQGVKLCQGLSTILTSHVQFDGRGKFVHVPAPGTLWHHIPAGQATPGEPDGAGAELQLSWGDWLEYDDSNGLGRCRGATMAVFTQPGSERDILYADSAEIHLAPAGPGGKGRVLQTASAIGTPDRRATAESKRFGPDGSIVQQVTYVEGTRIDLDQANQVFEVPTDGRLLFADHREPAPEASGASNASGGSGASSGLALGPRAGRGDTLMSWTSAMRYERGQGKLHVTGGVRSIHVLEQDRMQLDCEDLVAFISPAGAQAPQGRLTSALASGGAWLRSQGRELAAGQVSYDATTEVAAADANVGGPVTITDPKTGVPVKANRVTWYLKGDRVEAQGVRQIAAPK